MRHFVYQVRMHVPACSRSRKKCFLNVFQIDHVPADNKDIDLEAFIEQVVYFATITVFS